MVSQEAIDNVRNLYIKADHVIFDLVPPELDTFINVCYVELGHLVIERGSIWLIYCSVLDHIQERKNLVALLEQLDGSDLQDDAELHLMENLEDLHENNHGYMGGVANGMGLRKY